MSESKRFIVLEIVDHVEVLKECVEFLAMCSPDSGLRVIGHRDAASIIYFLTRDAVDASLAHIVGSLDNIDSIISILYGVPKTKVNKSHHDAYKVISSHSLWVGVEQNITRQVRNYIPLESWTDWTVIKSAGLVGLTEGEDHRIAEFHKLAKSLPDDDGTDEAVTTINCTNPINYLYTQFYQRYGHILAEVNTYYNNPDVKIDPFYRNILVNFINNPMEQMAAFFCEGITRVNPQIELAKHCPSVDLVLFKILQIFDIESFYRDVVAKLVIAFGMGQLGYSVKSDESYQLEYYQLTGIISIFKKAYSTHTEKYEDDLLHALNRGDYLPYGERIIAERIFAERANMVLSLRQ